MARGVTDFETAAVWPVVAACLLWSVFLNGGTLALNSAVDRDNGDIGYLNNPPPIPKGLASWGLGLMVLGGLLAIPLGTPFLLLYALSFVLSILYSVPPVRLKARGGWDVIINMTGYGALTALAGWVAVAPWPDFSDALLFAGFAFLFGAVYPMTQFYQMDEDREKGAWTLALMLGARGSMVFIHLCLGLTFLCWTGALQGRIEANAAPGVIGLSLLLIQGLGWLLFSLHWWKNFEGYPHQKGLYRSMVLWALSNAALIVAFGFPGV